MEWNELGTGRRECALTTELKNAFPSIWGKWKQNQWTKDEHELLKCRGEEKCWVEKPCDGDEHDDDLDDDDKDGDDNDDDDDDNKGDEKVFLLPPFCFHKWSLSFRGNRYNTDG